MSKSKSYWVKRFESIENQENKRARQTLKEVEKEFNRAINEIESKITVWYQRFADNNEITMREARKWLETDELKEFKWTVEEYIAYGKKNAINQQWMKELENASAKVHISRFESLNLELRQTLERVYKLEDEAVKTLASDVYSDQFYRTVFEIQKGFNLGWTVAQIDPTRIAKVINQPWTDDALNFSERIWNNKNKLISELKTEMTQMIMQGNAPDKAIKNISDKLKTSRFNAGRLVMTESAYFASASQQDAFKDLDVERYEIVATLDSSTSNICRNLDGDVVDMVDYQVGVTASPFHPFCRTVQVPYFDDNYTERLARGIDGKTYYVPGTIKYNEWKNKYVA